VQRPECEGENQAETLSCNQCSSFRCLSRRNLLKSVLGIGFALSFGEQAARAQTDPKKTRPQVGDLLVFALGDRAGQLITRQDVPSGGPPVTTYPKDPQSQIVRDGSRLNRVLLVRLAPEVLTEQTRSVAAEGIVGYSAVCTHTGCDVVGWENATQHLVCPCHTSTFDAKDRARVISGPAPKPLAALPLQIVDGKLTVAGPFSGRVGAEQK
jgi:rieske iron-sulfur protein